MQRHDGGRRGRHPRDPHRGRGVGVLHLDRALSRSWFLGLVAIPFGVLASLAAAWLILWPHGLDAAEVERDVAAEYEAREGIAIELSCPADMPEESGGVFPCRGTRSDGEVIPVEIQIADPDDSVDYRWWAPE